MKPKIPTEHQFIHDYIKEQLECLSKHLDDREILESVLENIQHACETTLGELHEDDEEE